MRLNDSQRKEIVDFLTTNCECWAHNGDAEILNKLSDEKLTALKEYAEKEQQMIAVANAAANGFSDPDTGVGYRINPDTAKVERRAVANAQGGFPKKGMKKGEEEEEEEEEEVENEEAAYVRKTNAKRMAGNSSNRSKPQTQEQIINALPLELRERLKVAGEVEQREKDSVIGQILANSSVAEADKRAHYDWLSNKSVEELRSTLALMPKQGVQEQVARAVTNTRRPNRPVVGGAFGREDPDMLEMPTWNWEEMGKEGKKEKTQSTEATVNLDDSDMGSQSAEDDLQQLPPHLRRIVQGAMVVENREKRKIIDQLVENVADEQHEQRLRAKLERKPLDELRDMLAMVPPKKEQTRNYFGSAGGPNQAALANNQNRADVFEDVLLLPRMDYSDTQERKAR